MDSNYEMQLIGLLINKPKLLDNCQILFGFTAPFRDPRLNQIFIHIQQIYDFNGIDKRELMKLGVEKKINLDFYGTIAASTGFEISINDYIQDVYNDAVKRQLEALGQTLVNCTQDGLTTAREYLRTCRATIDSIEKASCIKTGVSITEAIKEVKEKAEMLSQGDNKHYMKTGLLAIDKIIMGLTVKTMSIFAARPSVGKTAGAITIMSNMAKQGIATGFISVEMSEAEIVERLAQVRSDVSIYNFANQNMQESDKKKFFNHLDSFDGNPLIQIERTTNRSINNIRSMAITMKNNNPELKVIFIDYIQKLKGPDTRQDMRQQISEVSAIITDMATDLNVHIMALAQINREGDDLPKVKNLKETGNLEQDAHYIFLLHRDLTEQHKGSYDNDAVIGIAKNRGGRTGIANVKYNATTTRFYDDCHNYVNEEV